MSKNKKNSKSKKNIKNTKATKLVNKFSKKGLKGTVGAPKKEVNWPAGAFTAVKAFNANQRVCELSIRNRIKEALKDGSLIELTGKKKPEGTRGRPEARYVLAANFNAETMTKKVEVVQTEVAAGQLVPVAEVIPTQTENQPTETVQEQPAAPVVEMIAEPIIEQTIAPVEIAQAAPVAAPTMAEVANAATDEIITVQE